MGLIKKKIEGIPMYLPENDKGVGQRLIARGKREECYMWLLRREAHGTAIEAGANIGYCTLSLARKCDTVHAFEPDVRTYKVLEKNIDLNRFSKKVHLHQQAVTDKRKVAKLYRGKRPNLSTMLGKDEGTKDVTLVNTISLDDFCSANNVEPTFLKADIEGAETALIHGGIGTLLYARECKLLFEVHPSRYGPENDFAKALRLLLKHGYSYKYVVNAKGKWNEFYDLGLKPVKKFKGLKRAVWDARNIDTEKLIHWTCTEPEDGLKVIRAILLEKKDEDQKRSSTEGTAATDGAGSDDSVQCDSDRV